MTVPVSSKMSTLISQIDNGENGNKNGKIDSKEEIQMFTYRANNTLKDFDSQLDRLYEKKGIFEDKSQQHRTKTAKTTSTIGGLAGAVGLGLKFAGYGASMGLFGAVLGGAAGLIVGYFAGKGIGALTDSQDNVVDDTQEQIQTLVQQKQQFEEEYKTMKEQLSING